MVDGRLVALDTPARLKKTWVPERVLVARGQGLAAAAPALRALAGVRGVVPFGAALHLRVEPERVSDADVAAALAAAGARDVRVEAAEPTLEDVFLAVVDRGGRAEAP
jgi:ABC-2 type transport system ATP-binding protein